MEKKNSVLQCGIMRALVKRQGLCVSVRMCVCVCFVQMFYTAQKPMQRRPQGLKNACLAFFSPYLVDTHAYKAILISTDY